MIFTQKVSPIKVFLGATKLIENVFDTLFVVMSQRIFNWTKDSSNSREMSANYGAGLLLLFIQNYIFYIF